MATWPIFYIRLITYFFILKKHRWSLSNNFEFTKVPDFARGFARVCRLLVITINSNLCPSSRKNIHDKFQWNQFNGLDMKAQQTDRVTFELNNINTINKVISLFKYTFDTWWYAFKPFRYYERYKNLYLLIPSKLNILQNSPLFIRPKIP